MKIVIETNDREVTKVAVDYDKTKPVEKILAEYSGALVTAQSERIEDLIDELGVDDKKKEGLMEAQHISNKFIFDLICKTKVKRKNTESLSSVLGLIALLKALGEDE